MQVASLNYCFTLCCFPLISLLCLSCSLPLCFSLLPLYFALPNTHDSLVSPSLSTTPHLCSVFASLFLCALLQSNFIKPHKLTHMRIKTIGTWRNCGEKTWMNELISESLIALLMYMRLRYILQLILSIHSLILYYAVIWLAIIQQCIYNLLMK